MKSSELNKLIESSLYNEVKDRIITESKNINHEVYEIICEGEPVEICETEKEAQEIVDKLRKEHPGKQFIIEKKTYESYENMLDELDKMGEELQEKENKNMEKEPVKVKSLAEAVLHAKQNNVKRIKVSESIVDVEETWKKMEEEESQCDECGDKGYMEEYEDIGESNAFILAADAARDKGEKEFEFPKGSGKMHKVTLSKDIEVNEDDVEPITEKMSTCNECGGEMKEGMCMECGMMEESTKTKLRLKESELVSLIGKMVTEAAKGQPGIPGIPGVTVTKRAQSTSKKDSGEHAKEVADKLKKYLSFEGNDNPEFPKPIGKGEKMAYRNTPENEEKIEDKRGETASDLSFDYEPSEGFKQRIKKSLEGDSTMGNSSDAGNVVKDKVGSKIVDKTKRKIENNKKKKEVSWGHSWENPSDARIVKESNNKLSNILEEEFEKIKKLSNYNKKTQ